jgi:sporadic carbohydrate cluster 2OG-Fe(II) oxygenase
MNADPMNPLAPRKRITISLKTTLDPPSSGYNTLATGTFTPSGGIVLERMATLSFLAPDDAELSERFLSDGYVIRSCESPDELERFSEWIRAQANRWLVDSGLDAQIHDLHGSHSVISASFLNDLRLHLFATINAHPDSRKIYFTFGASLLQSLVGNELAMQNKLNLSIQQPGDQTSVLEMHSDAWTGDSPFQVVLWVPLTNSTGTNAMYLLSPEKSIEAYGRVRNGQLASMSEIQVAYQSHFKPIEVNRGEILAFDSNCLHGNQLNTTSESRWSINCRFTSLMAPSTSPECQLGSFYTPIMVRPATRMGLRAISALGLD